jgi:hypothetical protein
MTLDRCPTCREFVFSKHHKCKPAWLVAIVPSNEDTPDNSDYRTYYADDEEAAAEKAADAYDCDGDYPILSQGERSPHVAWVKSGHNTAPIKCSVYGEAVPAYHARKLKSRP